MAKTRVPVPTMPCPKQQRKNGSFAPSVRCRLQGQRRWGRRIQSVLEIMPSSRAARLCGRKGNLVLGLEVHCREGLATSFRTVEVGSLGMRKRFVDAWRCWETLWLGTWWLGLGCVAWRGIIVHARWQCLCRRLSLSQVDGVML
jgi:hypothetical protein